MLEETADKCGLAAVDVARLALVPRTPRWRQWRQHQPAAVTSSGLHSPRSAENAVEKNKLDCRSFTEVRLGSKSVQSEDEHCDSLKWKNGRRIKKRKMAMSNLWLAGLSLSDRTREGPVIAARSKIKCLNLSHATFFKSSFCFLIQRIFELVFCFEPTCGSTSV